MWSKGACSLELKVRRFPGRIITSGYDRNLKYLDQIWNPKDEKDSEMIYTESEIDEVFWIHCRKFSGYLRSCYGINFEEYHNLCLFGDIDHFVKCSNPDCKSKAAWSGKLSKGYLSTCGDEQCSYDILCINASSGVIGFGNMHNNPELYPEYNQFIKDGGNWNLMYSNPTEYPEFTSKITPGTIDNFKLECNKSYKIGLGSMVDIDEVIFYILDYIDFIKIGVTSEDLQNRILSFNKKRKLKITPIVLYEIKGNPSTILKLEYDLKLSNFNNLYFNSGYGWTECFLRSKYNEILTQISLNKFNDYP